MEEKFLSEWFTIQHNIKNEVFTPTGAKTLRISEE